MQRVAVTMNGFCLFAAQRSYLSVGVSLFCLGACFASPSHAQAQKPAARAGVKTPGCPSRKAEAFFEAFTSDIDIQRAYTDFPLQYGYLVGYATSKSVTLNKFEDLPFLGRTHGRIAEHSGIGNAPDDLSFEFQEKTAKAFVVGIGRMRGDYYITYEFIMKNNCWRLIRVDDLNDHRAR
jgi:hypothetical protein